MFALLLAAAATTLTCPVEKAHYISRTASDVTARFEAIRTNPDWPAGVALHIAFKTGRAYDFLPSDGGSSGTQRLTSTEDISRSNYTFPSPDGGPRPLGDFDYFATDAAYTVVNDIPRRGAPAPAHILIPRLGDALRHQTDLNKKDDAPQQFFDLSACDS